MSTYSCVKHLIDHRFEHSVVNNYHLKACYWSQDIQCFFLFSVFHTCVTFFAHSITRIQLVACTFGLLTLSFFILCLFLIPLTTNLFWFRLHCLRFSIISRISYIHLFTYSLINFSINQQLMMNSNSCFRLPVQKIDLSLFHAFFLYS